MTTQANPTTQQIVAQIDKPLTDAQTTSLSRVIAHQGLENYITAYYDHLCDCIIVRFSHITIGIEPDGYAHS